MSVRLGRVQLRIMQVLWRLKRATAKEITDAMNADEPIAHSSVQTLLRTLEAKKAINHEVDARTFVFYPVIREDQVAHSVTQELVDRVFAGSVSGMVAYLLKNEDISPEELKEIRRLVNEKARK